MARVCDTRCREPRLLPMLGDGEILAGPAVGSLYRPNTGWMPCSWYPSRLSVGSREYMTQTSVPCISTSLFSIPSSPQPCGSSILAQCCSSLGTTNAKMARPLTILKPVLPSRMDLQFIRKTLIARKRYTYKPPFFIGTVLPMILESPSFSGGICLFVCFIHRLSQPP